MLRNFRKLLISGTALILVSGCTHLAPREFEYRWVRSDRPVLPMTLEVVKEYPEDAKRLCSGHFPLWACAVMYYKEDGKTWDRCVVYTIYENLPDFLMSHEKKHCDGWDHS